MKLGFQEGDGRNGEVLEESGASCLYAPGVCHTAGAERSPQLEGLLGETASGHRRWAGAAAAQAATGPEISS